MEKPISPVFDIHDVIAALPIGPKYLDQQAALLAGLGFRRFYLIQPLAEILAPWRDLSGAKLESNAVAARARFLRLDPFHESVLAAKRHGLEAFAVFKPHEGGALWSAPADAPGLCPRRPLPQLGGYAAGLDPFLVDHPTLRVRRRPDTQRDRRAQAPIAAIECCFCLDGIIGSSYGGRRPPGIEYAAQPDSALADNPAQNLRVWTSKTNGAYEPLAGAFRITERVERRPIRDTAGHELPGGPRRCRVLRLEGLHIGAETQYLAVSFGAPNPAGFVTIPFTMIQAFSAAGDPVPITVTDALRDGAAFPQGDPNRPRARGFEFEPIGLFYWEPGWRTATTFGIARGKVEYMKGTPCEAYPEVRAHWLAEIQSMIDMCFDGVDIRIQNHSSAVTDCTEFGCNEPLVAAYRERHGVNILAEPADPLKLMRLRGDFCLDFVKEACELLHAHGRKLQVHLRDSFEHPQLGGDFNQIGFWAMPKILPDWQRLVDLADEVTIKDYGFGVYRPENAAGIKARAVSAGKPVWIHCYTTISRAVA